MKDNSHGLGGLQALVIDSCRTTNMHEGARFGPVYPMHIIILLFRQFDWQDE